MIDCASPFACLTKSVINSSTIRPASIQVVDTVVRIRTLTKAIVNGQELVVDGPGKNKCNKKTFYIVDNHHPIVTYGIYKPQDTSILLPILLMFLAAQSPLEPNGNWAAHLFIDFVMEKKYCQCSILVTSSGKD